LDLVGAFLPLTRTRHYDLRWTQAEGSRKRGDSELQLLLSRAHRESGDFQHAAKHFLHAEAPAELAALVFDWSKKGYASEADLYVARAVLQYVIPC
jgi:hypothetical protein